LLSRLKERLRAGISTPIGAYELTLLRVRRAAAEDAPASSKPEKSAPPPIDLAASSVRFLVTRFPQLSELQMPLAMARADELLAVFHAALPAFHPDARGVAVRNALWGLRQVSEPSLQAAVTRAIAVSDLADGMPDRARILRDDSTWGVHWREQAAALDSAYGAPIASQDWSDRSRDASMCWYIETHAEQARGKAILHVAPEPGLCAMLKDLGREYVGLDATGGAGIDVVADLCDIGLESGRFDLVVCHRVLEHVVDDARAMREMRRVLKPGGTLQVSVPQAVHRPRTLEWIVPDLTQHQHVRLYGADLTARLEAAGFRVQLEDWLLRQTEESWRRHGAYPMRFYSARAALELATDIGSTNRGK
jgi:SAM-dependent methyltransferase